MKRWLSIIGSLYKTFKLKQTAESDNDEFISDRSNRRDILICKNHINPLSVPLFSYLISVSRVAVSEN